MENQSGFQKMAYSDWLISLEIVCSHAIKQKFSQTYCKCNVTHIRQGFTIFLLNTQTSQKEHVCAEIVLFQ